VTTNVAATSPRERRRTFVGYLYGLNAALTRDAPRAAQARRELARLRRSIAGPRQEIEAYDVVFRHDPPQAEQEVWLLLAGLFAIYPHANSAPRRSMGGAMRLLARRRGESAERRFTQLLSVDRNALPHYLRQAVRLLRTEDVAIDYDQLLNDLLVLLKGDFSDPDAHRVRLQWARDFHRVERTDKSTDSVAT
jgi:CRISPR system Cascade subunit CasB